MGMVVIRDRGGLLAVLDSLKTGDQLFFGGSGWWSEAIEAWTDSVISHCATVIAEGYLKWLVEMLPSGIRVSSVSHRVNGAEDCWAALMRRASCPLRKNIVDRVTEFLGSGVGYDYAAIRSYFFGRRPKEDLSRLYCSELSGVLIRESGLIPRDFSAAMTPQEVAMLQVYEPEYYCLRWKGAPKEIRGFNTVVPLAGGYAGRAINLGERRNGG